MSASIFAWVKVGVGLGIGLEVGKVLFQAGALVLNKKFRADTVEEYRRRKLKEEAKQKGFRLVMDDEAGPTVTGDYRSESNETPTSGA